MKLQKNIPDCILRRETKCDKLVNETRNRAERYEEKLKSLCIGDIYRKYGLNESNKYATQKFKALEEIDIDNELINRWKREVEVISEKILEKGGMISKVKDIEKIQNLSYEKDISQIMLQDWEKDEEPDYLKSNLEIQLLARYRTGGEYNDSKAWLNDNEKSCRLCDEAPETVKHVIEECSEIKYKNKVDRVLASDGCGIAFLKSIEWKRKIKYREKKSKENDDNNNTQR